MDEQRADVRRENPIVTVVMFISIIAVLFAIAFEWEHYRRLTQWNRVNPTVVEQTLLFGTIWLKSILVLSLASIPAILLFAVHRYRTGFVGLFVGSGIVLSWLAVDVKMREITGNHVLDYLPYLFDHNPLEWAGGADSLATIAAPTLIGLFIATAVLLFAAHRVSISLTRRMSQQFQTAGVSIWSSLVLLMFLGQVYGESLCKNPGLMSQLRAALPLPLPASENVQTGDVGGFRHEFEREINASLTSQQEPAIAVPTDLAARVESENLPNVLLVVLESLRHDALPGPMMPRLTQRAESGMIFERHFAGSNVSHFGLFTLLYGRSPLAFEQTLDAKIKPQLTVTLRQSGYHCSFFTSGTVHWGRMEEFINEKTFDEVVVDTDGDWANCDQRIIDRVKGRLNDGSTKPKFVTAFLMSTHFPYTYPAKYETHQPVVDDFTPPDLHERREFRSKFMNRYRNAAGFLDDKLAQLIDSTANNNTIVIITGDHGESIFDDDTLAHGSKPSEIQLRVPHIMFGPGIGMRNVSTATRHADIMPTLFHALAGEPSDVANCDGRDLLNEAPHHDEVVVTPYRAFEPHHLVGIRNHQRLHVKYWPDRAKVQMVGFVDHLARVKLDDIPQRSEAKAWADLIKRELHTFHNSTMPNRSGLTLSTSN